MAKKKKSSKARQAADKVRKSVKAAVKKIEEVVRLGALSPKQDTPCSRGSDTFGYLLGYGKDDYPFDWTAINNGVGEEIDSLVELPNAGKKAGKETVNLHPFRPFPFPGQPRFANVNRANDPDKALSKVRRRAKGYELRWSDPERRLEDAVSKRFDAMMAAFTLNKERLPKAWHQPCDSLAAQLTKMEEGLPAVLLNGIEQVHAKFPDATRAQAYEAVLKAIDRQLAPILSTLYIWALGIRQWLNPKYHKRLVILQAKIRQKLYLLLTGGLNNTGDVKQRIATIALSVGDLVIPVLIGQDDGGPAVIPMDGALGTRGAHAMLFPMEMLDDIASTDPIYAHEMGHLFFSIVRGLAEDNVRLIQKSLTDAYKSGRLKFSVDTVQIGPGSEVPTINFVIKMFVDMIGELHADMIGSLVSGPPAFGSNFFSYVGALTGMATDGVEKAEKLLRSVSSYTLEATDKGVQLNLESHPQDFVRVAYWQAAIARLTGFPEVAIELKAMAEAESGKDVPTVITWKYRGPQADDEGTNDGGDDDQHQSGGLHAIGDLLRPRKPKFADITLAVVDFAAASDVLAEDWLKEKMPSLGGLSHQELVWLTPDMQKEKVDPITALLRQGKQDLPNDGRHYYLHIVGSAASLAYDGLCDEGKVTPDQAATTANGAGEVMMYTLAVAWDDSGDILTGDGKSDDDTAGAN